MGARILCLCPSHRDRRELPRLVNGHALRFHDYASLALEQVTVPGASARPGIADPQREIDAILERCRRERIDAVVSTDDYPGAALASIVAHELGLPGPAPRASLVSQHKFLSRQVQARAAPECVPPFQLIDVREEAPAPPARFPLFVKPVKSFFSVGAGVVDDARGLERQRARWRPLRAFFRPLDRMLHAYAGAGIGHGYLIGEGLLRGRQATLECYVQAGRLVPIGVVDSIFHRGTLAFRRFEYPSSLPPRVQERMADAAGRALAALGYDNGLANVEFMHDGRTGTLGIVEINPRMSSQFADLFEKVDGTNTYGVLLDLALGKRPRLRRARGAHRAAASCVLRRFEDRYVRAVPDEARIRALQARWPDARIEVLAEAGMRLSQQMQDDCSYRYGLVNIGGRDRGEVLARYRTLRRQLRFDFADREP